MKLIVEKDYESLSKRTAGILEKAIRENPKIVLGLATGSTPLGTYRELIRAHEEEALDFSQVQTFNLDEYIGLNGSHPSSYKYYMNKEFFNYININPDNVHIPNGKAENLEEYCREYDREIIEAGGIDIQILGIGSNGHIAFMEPADELFAETSIVSLTESTIRDNSRFFDSMEEVPKTAITMGIGRILKAKKIILLANGESKAPIMKKLIERNTVTTQLPASFLLLHPDVTVIVDKEAYGG